MDNKKEKEPSPCLKRLTVYWGRHANRTPGGELTEEGIKKAGVEGEKIISKPDHQTFTSDQQRAIDSAAIIEANAARPINQEAYNSLLAQGGDRAVQDYMFVRTKYNTSTGYGEHQNPEMYYSAAMDKETLGKITKMISDATLETWKSDPLHTTTENLLAEYILNKNIPPNLTPREQQLLRNIKPRISKMREEHQHIGINKLIETMPEETKNLAGASAKELIKIIDESRKNVSADQIEKSALEVSHSGFFDALLKYAMVRKGAKGERIVGFNKMEEIGGHQQPVEIYKIEIDFDENGGVRRVLIPIPENRKNAPAFVGLEKIELDWEIVQKLAYEFQPVSQNK